MNGIEKGAKLPGCPTHPNWATQTRWATKPLEYYHLSGRGSTQPFVEIKSKWDFVPKVVIALSLGTLLFQLAFSIGVRSTKEEIRNRILNANSTKIKIPELNLMLSAHQGVIIQKIELGTKDSKW